MTASPPSTSGTSTSTCNPYGSFLRGILAEISAMRGLRISRYYAEPGRGYTPSDKSGRDCGAEQLVALRSWVTIQCISFPRTRLAVERWIRRGALLRMLEVARVSIDFTVEDVPFVVQCLQRRIMAKTANTATSRTSPARLYELRTSYSYIPLPAREHTQIAFAVHKAIDKALARMGLDEATHDYLGVDIDFSKTQQVANRDKAVEAFWANEFRLGNEVVGLSIGELRVRQGTSFIATRKEGELFYPAATGKELLKYLGWGSPCLRVVLDGILGHKVLQPPNLAKYNHHQKLILVDLYILCILLSSYHLAHR
ncbi:hypothetical protein E8E15_007781 [Penicillium rubens]|uniref:uncharacterized protein n=1 Tax=Penicillium rubens TaxID=1108849 RepID=UPI001D5E96C1|nr:uncharacterized protein N7525_008782 [Penicillium rubens]KAF3023348.1 hypothetical protein E8E15_007781 [Penicillium rubens]KAJ5830529.1 hypothetical protein N7525_008782 [Penicillium rubens]